MGAIDKRTAPEHPRTVMVRSGRVNHETHEYIDAAEGFRGYLVFDQSSDRLAAGGFRVQRGLSQHTVKHLARAMTLKQRLLGLAVDGAKCGIDYDPALPGKREAMRRFLGFLKPYLVDRLSMGPDRNTTWSEIEGIAHGVGLPSVKIAIAARQGLSNRDFRRRIALLNSPAGALTLGERRAGHALAHAAIAAAEWTGCSRGMRVALQGFGTLGRGAALSLAEAGVWLTAVADEHGCLFAHDRLDTHALLALPQGTPVSQVAHGDGKVAPREALWEVGADVVILAACENAFGLQQAEQVAAHAATVAVGANLGLSENAEAMLQRRGVVVVPDFVAGCGGSASMDALFGPPLCPTVSEVLDRVAITIRRAVGRVLSLASDHGIYTRHAALELCRHEPCGEDTRPYGRWARSA